MSTEPKPEQLPLRNEQLDHITRQEALNFLAMNKAAYVQAVNEQEEPHLIAQYRIEMRFWEDYLCLNTSVPNSPKSDTSR